MLYKVFFDAVIKKTFPPIAILALKFIPWYLPLKAENVLIITASEKTQTEYVVLSAAAPLIIIPYSDPLKEAYKVLITVNRSYRKLSM